MEITTTRRTMCTGLVMTLLFLSTLAAKAQDVDQAGVYHLHSYQKKFLNFLLQHFLSTDGTIQCCYGMHNNNMHGDNISKLYSYDIVHVTMVIRGDHALQQYVLSAAC